MADTFSFSRVWERILTIKVGLVISRIYKSCEFLLQTRPQSSVSSPRISKLNSNVSNSGVTCQRKHWFWLLVFLRSFCLTVFAGTDDLQLFVYLPVHYPDLMQFFFYILSNIDRGFSPNGWQFQPSLQTITIALGGGGGGLVTKQRDFQTYELNRI